jgi:RNA polymerase sigma-70 factor (ECF subfamily)
MSSVSRVHIEADASAPAFADSGDAELLRKARNGDRAAYGRIVELHQDRLFNAILRMVGEPEEARELTQETFTRGLLKIDTFRGESQPYTWLFRIGMNLAISQLRKVQRRRTFSLDAPPGRNGKAAGDDQATLLDRLTARSAESPAQIAERRERDQQVLAALGRLDAEYRAVLVMRDIEGFDYAQMADVLGLPLGTLKSRLFRARLALRDELQLYMNELKK